MQVCVSQKSINVDLDNDVDGDFDSFILWLFTSEKI